MSKAPVRAKLNDKADESTTNLRDPVWFREWFKVIVREWAQHLTLRQLGMVIFIFDRTAAWGKEWELIRYSSFVTGITNKDGDKRYAAGICGCERSALTLTNELITMGMLRKRRSREGNYWALNYEWQPNDMNKIRKLNRNPQKLAGLNTQKPAGLNTQKPAGHNKSKAQMRNASQKEQYPDTGEGSSSIIQEALARARAKGQAALERRKTRDAHKIKMPDIIRLWAETCREADWAGHITPREYLTKQDAYALKAYSTRFSKAFPTQPFSDYLKWVLNNWPGLIAEQFHWMTKAAPPEAPAPLFFIKWCAKFEEAFLHSRAFEKRMTLTPEERKIDKLIRSGMSREDAERSVRRLVPGGNLVKHVPTKIITLTRKTKSIPDRRSKDAHLSLPSMGDSNPYEEQ
jgi:hypothetical protein